MNTTLLLVGCGKMGGAMLDGWLARGLDPDRVWIVEPNAETAADLASRLGVHTLAGADGLPADLKPDVVLTDIEMPRMDGFDLVRNIRADARLHDLPVVVITSRLAEKHRRYALEVGADHYLGKPYQEEELLALVARYARAGEA